MAGILSLHNICQNYQSDIIANEEIPDYPRQYDRDRDTLFVDHSTLLAQAQTQESQLKTHAIGNLTFKAPRNWLENPRGASANSLTLHNKNFPDRGGGFAPKGLIRVVATISEENLETATKAEFQKSDA